MQARGTRGGEPVAAEGRPPRANEVVGASQQPPYHPIGADALSPLLLRVAFPATKEEIVDAIGEARIAVSHDRTRSVAEVLDLLAPERYASSLDVERALETAWPEVSQAQGRGGRARQGDDLSGRPR
jgi:hypothetical protein